MPLLLLLGAGFAGWWFLRRSGNSALYPPLDENADAISLLNFPPYTLFDNRYTYGYFMSPSGFTEDQVKTALESAFGVEAGPPAPGRLVGKIDAVTLRRRFIPLLGPMSDAPPTFADVWAVQGYKDSEGGNPNSPPTTVSPASVLQQNLRDAQIAIPTEVSSLAPNRALAALLYLAANDPLPARKFLFIPIGASQQR